MGKAVLSLAALCCLLASATVTAQSPKPFETVPVDEIHAGMRGVAYTVFQGVKPEPMDVEVLGVMKNVNGPKGDIILIRLHGTKAEYTGVVAGMSGSPVYIDGKLAGALAFRIGEFSKEPIAGVTPISEMLEINAMDRRPGGDSAPIQARAGAAETKTSGPGMNSASISQNVGNYLRPIDTPLVFNGFSEETIRRFAPQFASAGVVPVMGAGSHSDVKQPEPLEPGSAVSAILVRGDMDIAATCTVTYVDPQCTFVQDRHTGIMGVFDKQPDMIPVTLTIHGGPTSKEFHYEVLNNAKLSPVAMMATVFNALHGINEYGEEITYRMNGSISVKGYPDVTLQNMFAPGDSGQPAAALAALSLGDRFGRIYDNHYDVPDIRGVKVDFDLVKERRWARLESTRTDVTEARPGDEIVVETVLRPYRGERILRQIPIHIPTSTSKGSLRILVSDGETLDRMRRGSSIFGRKLGLGPTIALLNKEHANNRVYVSLLEADPEAMVADKVMPTLPLSVMNVMEGMRGTQEMVVLGESSVNEAATAPLDYEVAGGQVLTITIK